MKKMSEKELLSKRWLIILKIHKGCAEPSVSPTFVVTPRLNKNEENNQYGNKNVSIVHGCPTRPIIFHVQWTMKLGSKL